MYNRRYKRKKKTLMIDLDTADYENETASL